MVTALQSKIGSGMFRRFRLHALHLLRSWQMDLLLRGEIQLMVVIVLQSKINLHTCSRCCQHASPRLVYFRAAGRAGLESFVEVRCCIKNLQIHHQCVRILFQRSKTHPFWDAQLGK